MLELELTRSLGSSQRSGPEGEEGDGPLTPADSAAANAELARECPHCGRGVDAVCFQNRVDR